MLKLPDWEHWGRMRDVTLRDALVLSLNLCPNSYAHEIKSRKEQKFAQRYLNNLHIVKSHIYGSDWLVGRVAKAGFDVDASFTTVDLPKFCKWAFGVVKLVELPDQMKRLGDPDWTPPNLPPAVVKPETPSTSHQIESGRKDILSPVIDKARSEASNPDKWQEVWPILCGFAEAKARPLIGVADTSVKYQDGDIVKFLSKENFRKRMQRLVSRQSVEDATD
jgi:hypothetical protein